MGMAIARRLARDGMKIGVLDINGDAATEVAEEICREGGQAVALQADASDLAQVEAAVARLRDTLGVQLSMPNMGHYYASKGGVISLTRCLAAEPGASGITANIISPGFIDTPMARRAIDGGKFPVAPEAIYSAYPIPRMGKAEEIAAACAFFVSEGASYITAQHLGVNGGAAV